MVYLYGAFSSFSEWGNEAVGLKCWIFSLSYK